MKDLCFQKNSHGCDLLQNYSVLWLRLRNEDLKEQPSFRKTRCRLLVRKCENRIRKAALREDQRCLQPRGHLFCEDHELFHEKAPGLNNIWIHELFLKFVVLWAMSICGAHFQCLHFNTSHVF